MSFNPNYVVPPGNTLSESLAIRKISIEEFSKRTSYPVSVLLNYICGERMLESMPQIFERELGIPAQFWRNLEKKYWKRLKTRKEKP